MGKLVNKRELAELFGISERTLTRYQHEGLPIARVGTRGVPNTYDTAEVHGWLVDRATCGASGSEGGEVLILDAERARLAKVQADTAELKLSRARGELVETEAAMRAWGQVIQTARARLLAIAPKAAPLLIGVRTPAEAQAIVDTLVCEALAELANPDLTGVVDEPADAPDLASGDA